MNPNVAWKFLEVIEGDAGGIKFETEWINCKHSQ